MLLMWTVEGGYFLGRAGMDHALCLALSVGARICVMNVDYRLAPEAPFPTALNDCYTAVKWVRNPCRYYG
jgi:acetyl esterase/lipase